MRFRGSASRGGVATPAPAAPPTPEGQGVRRATWEGGFGSGRGLPSGRGPLGTFPERLVVWPWAPRRDLERSPALRRCLSLRAQAARDLAGREPAELPSLLEELGDRLSEVEEKFVSCGYRENRMDVMLERVQIKRRVARVGAAPWEAPGGPTPGGPPRGCFPPSRCCRPSPGDTHTGRPHCPLGTGAPAPVLPRVSPAQSLQTQVRPTAPVSPPRTRHLPSPSVHVRATHTSGQATSPTCRHVSRVHVHTPLLTHVCTCSAEGRAEPRSPRDTCTLGDRQHLGHHTQVTGHV